jgi:TRAP transporter TAXI family solute receptor
MKRFILPFALAFFASASGAQDLSFINIGSGDLVGGYYKTAKALCAPINRAGAGKVRCSPEPTAGSIYNLKMLAQGELDFALAQSDWQLAAYEGTGPFSGNPMSNLRSVMSLYPEVVTILAGRDSGIYKSQDLPGKRLDIGLPSSGRYATAKMILARTGLNVDEFGAFFELTTAQAVSGLCDGTIDATFLVVGHPSDSVARALAECEARLIAPSGPILKNVFAESSGFSALKIAAGTYPEQTQDIPSYAVYATLVTRADVPSSLVTLVVESTLNSMTALKKRVSQLDDLKLSSIGTRGLSAPLHSASSAVLDKFNGEN